MRCDDAMGGILKCSTNHGGREKLLYIIFLCLPPPLLIHQELCHGENMGIGMLTSRCVNLLVKRIERALPQVCMGNNTEEMYILIKV